MIFVAIYSYKIGNGTIQFYQVICFSFIEANLINFKSPLTYSQGGHNSGSLSHNHGADDDIGNQSK